MNNYFAFFDEFCLFVILAWFFAKIPSPLDIKNKKIFAINIGVLVDYIGNTLDGPFFRIRFYKDFLVTGLFICPIKIFYKDITDCSVKLVFFIPFFKLIISTDKGSLHIYSRRKKLEKIIEIINQQKINLKNS